MEETKISGIFPVIDYYSAVVENCSLSIVARYFRVDDELNYYCKNLFTHLSTGDGVWMVLRLKGVDILIPQMQFNAYVDDPSFDILESRWLRLKVNVSGSGLAQLREYFAKELETSLDAYLRQNPSESFDALECRNWHITRCDFAYDLINYKPEFLDRCIEYCRLQREEKLGYIAAGENLNPDRVCCVGLRGGVLAQVKDYGEKSLTLGARNSDRKLQIYDKRREQCVDGAWKYGLSEKYGFPESWIRLEFRYRNDYAHKYLYSYTPSDVSSVKGAPALSSVEAALFWLGYQTFAFRMLGTLNNTNATKVADFWIDLFDWAVIDNLIEGDAPIVECKTQEEKNVVSIDKGAIAAVCHCAYEYTYNPAYDYLFDEGSPFADKSLVGCCYSCSDQPEMPLLEEVFREYSRIILHRFDSDAGRYLGYLYKLSRTLSADFESCRGIYYSDDPRLQDVPLVRGCRIYFDEGGYKNG